MRWIKLDVNEAKNFNMVITKAIKLALPTLKLEVGRDIREYLIWSVMGNFTYVLTSLRDLNNKNRLYNNTQKEDALWDKIIVNNNWQVVYDVVRKGDI